MPRFIPPSLATLRSAPPDGEAWLHEVKFDGYRVQLHKDGDEVCVYSKNGNIFNKRCRGILTSLEQLPVRSVILDGELVATDTDGKPDFHALHFRSAQENQIEVWCFDLLEVNGLDLRPLRLIERKEKLATLLACANDNLRYSEVFADPLKLLQACEQKLLEGIISKRADGPYRSGRSDWVKVKCDAWRAANKARGELFAPTK